MAPLAEARKIKTFEKEQTRSVEPKRERWLERERGLDERGNLYRPFQGQSQKSQGASRHNLFSPKEQTFQNTQRPNAKSPEPRLIDIKFFDPTDQRLKTLAPKLPANTYKPMAQAEQKNNPANSIRFLESAAINFLSLNRSLQRALESVSPKKYQQAIERIRIFFEKLEKIIRKIIENVLARIYRTELFNGLLDVAGADNRPNNSDPLYAGS